jgi:hypothetical protein
MQRNRRESGMMKSRTRKQHLHRPAGDSLVLNEAQLVRVTAGTGEPPVVASVWVAYTDDGKT